MLILSSTSSPLLQGCTPLGFPACSDQSLVWIWCSPRVRSFRWCCRYPHSYVHAPRVALNPALPTQPGSSLSQQHILCFSPIGRQCVQIIFLKLINYIKLSKLWRLVLYHQEQCEGATGLLQKQTPGFGCSDLVKIFSWLCISQKHSKSHWHLLWA